MLPQGFPERMLHLLGEAEFAEFLASYERPRSAGLRLNPRKVMDYDWLYERLNPMYNDKVGRPGTDPVVLIKMVLIQSCSLR